MMKYIFGPVLRIASYFRSPDKDKFNYSILFMILVTSSVILTIDATISAITIITVNTGSLSAGYLALIASLIVSSTWLLNQPQHTKYIKHLHLLSSLPVAVVLDHLYDRNDIAVFLMLTNAFLAALLCKPQTTLVYLFLSGLPLAWLGSYYNELSEIQNIFKFATLPYLMALLLSYTLNRLFDYRNKLISQAEKMHQQEQLIVGEMAHKIKTPLTIIKNTANKPEQQKIFQQALSRLETSITQLSAITKFSLSNYRNEDDMLDLATLLNDVVHGAKTLSLQYPQLNIKFCTSNETRSFSMLYGSYDQINEAVLTLLDLIMSNLTRAAENIINLQLSMSRFNYVVTIEVRNEDFKLSQIKESENWLLANNLLRVNGGCLKIDGQVIEISLPMLFSISND